MIWVQIIWEWHCICVNKCLIWGGTVFVYCTLKSAEVGAQTSLYCAASAQMEGVGGGYFSDCAPATAARDARDSDAAQRLWLLFEQLTGLSHSQIQ